uniref:Uncharacterized protein n=1 Tax=viral metagenome TaxID=1070528 RepID=A0A6C0D1A0_9ZZZZ
MTSLYKIETEVTYMVDKKTLSIPRYEMEEENEMNLRLLFHASHASPHLSWMSVKQEKEKYQVWNAVDIWYKDNLVYHWQTSTTLRERFEYYERQKIFSGEILFQSLIYVIYCESSSSSGLDVPKLRQLLGKFFLSTEMPTMHQMDLWKTEEKTLFKKYQQQQKKWETIDRLASSSAFSSFQKTLFPQFIGSGPIRTEIYKDPRALETIFWELEWSAPSLPWIMCAVLHSKGTNWVVVDPSRVGDVTLAQPILESYLSSSSCLHEKEEIIELFFLPLLLNKDDFEKENLTVVQVGKESNGLTTKTKITVGENGSFPLSTSEIIDTVLQFINIPLTTEKEIRDEGEKGQLDLSLSFWDDYVFKEYAMTSCFQSMFRMIDKFPTLESDIGFLFRFPPYYSSPTLLPFSPNFSIKPLKKDYLIMSITLSTPLPKRMLNVWILFLSIMVFDFSQKTTRDRIQQFHQEFLENSQLEGVFPRFPQEEEEEEKKEEDLEPRENIPPSTSDLGKVYPELFVKPTYKRFVCQKKQQPIIVSSEQAASIPEDKKLLFPLHRIETRHPIDPQIYTCPNPEYPYPVLSKITAPLIPLPHVYAPCCAKSPHPDKNKEALEKMYPEERRRENVRENLGGGVEESKEGYHEQDNDNIDNNDNNENNEQKEEEDPMIRTRENRIGKSHIIKSVGQLGNLPEELRKWLEWYNMGNEYLRIGHTHGWFSMLHAAEYWFTMSNRPANPPQTEEELLPRWKSKILHEGADMSIWNAYVPFFNPSQIRALWEAYFEKKIFLPLTMVAKAVELFYEKSAWYTTLVLFYRDKQDQIHYIDPYFNTMRYNMSETYSPRRQYVLAIYVHYGGGMNVVATRGVKVYPSCELIVYQPRIERNRMWSFPSDFVTFMQSPAPWYKNSALTSSFSSRTFKTLSIEKVIYELGPMGNVTVLHFEENISAMVHPGTFLTPPPSWEYASHHHSFQSLSVKTFGTFLKKTEQSLGELEWKQVYIYEIWWFFVCSYSGVDMTFVLQSPKRFSDMTEEEKKIIFETIQSTYGKIYICESSSELLFSSWLSFLTPKERYIESLKKELATAMKDIVVWRTMIYLKEYYKNNQMAWRMDGEPSRPLDTFYRRHVRVNHQPLNTLMEKHQLFTPIVNIHDLRSMGLVEEANSNSEKIMIPSFEFWKKCKYEIEWTRKNKTSMNPDKLEAFWNVSNQTLLLPSILQSYFSLSLQYPNCTVLPWKTFCRRILPRLSTDSWQTTPLFYGSLLSNDNIPKEYRTVKKYSHGTPIPFAWNFNKDENPYYPYFAWVYIYSSKEEATKQWWFWKQYQRMPLLPQDAPLLIETIETIPVPINEKILLPIPDTSFFYLLLPPSSYPLS